MVVFMDQDLIIWNRLENLSGPCNDWYQVVFPRYGNSLRYHFWARVWLSEAIRVFNDSPNDPAYFERLHARDPDDELKRTLSALFTLHVLRSAASLR